MDIKLYNSLHKKEEVFIPKKAGHVSLYHCGPTVYNYIHIGNLRAFICADIVRRVFEFNDYTVAQVMNITDIGHLQHDDIDEGEDKMTLALKREGKELSRETMKEIAVKYYDAFRSDMEKVNALPATLYPFASDHIEEDISFIQILIDKGHAYSAGDGIYFDTTSIAEYGRLGGIVREGDEAAAESRIGDEDIKKSQKKNIRDFALWKFNDQLGYEASFGKGFPGWHIECSVMSMKYLGEIEDMTTKPDWKQAETFDIHTGGVDHISVHHNNEIAQTEAMTGKPLADYWLHNAHIIIEGGKKMAKSGESFITLDGITEKGISPMGLRYWILGASYRSPMQFSYDALQNAENSYRSLIKSIVAEMKTLNEDALGDLDMMPSLAASDEIEEFRAAINEDFNTPNALAYLWTMLKKDSLTATDKIVVIQSCDHALGLDLINAAQTALSNARSSMVSLDSLPAEIRDLIEQRVSARAERNWAEADRLRDEIKAAGFDIVDSDQNSFELIKTS